MLKDRIKRIIDNMSCHQQVILNNMYCVNSKCMDSYIYDMVEFDEVLRDCTPSEIVEYVLDEDFSLNSDYFQFTDLGYIRSIWGSYDLDMSNVINYIIKQYNSLNNEEIQKILEEAGEAL